MVEEQVLRNYGAEVVTFEKGDILFQEGTLAHYYFQLVSGEVKMNNYSEEGKEFIQGIFSNQRSFGEPPLFGDFNYPANAIALKRTNVLRLGKESFMCMLKENAELSLHFNKVLSERLYYKSIMAAEISTQEAAHRVLRLIDYLKHDIYAKEERFAFCVELTRQQVADLTGLRVETVIRSIKRLEEMGELELRKQKVWR